MKTKIFAIFLMLSCIIQNTLYAQLQDTLTQHHYYSNEIIPDKYLDIYNKWVITDISGGAFGQGYTPDFDFMEIEKHGIYKLYRNDSLLHYGKINIEENDTENLLISFVKDTCTGDISFYDMIKYVFVNDSSLNLMAPCCDRYNYHFMSCDYFNNEHFYQENLELEEINISSIEMDLDIYLKRAVCYTTKDTGFIGCHDGKIYKTVNGGKNWNLKTIDNELPIYKIHFINNMVGYAVGGQSSSNGEATAPGSFVLKTIDSGENWEYQTVPYERSKLNDVFFINENKGFAVGLGLNIKTNDGGVTWEEFDIGFTGNVVDIDFVNETIGFACRHRNTVSKTIDGGNTWSNIPIDASNIQCIKFINDSIGFIGRNYGKILKTIDGGQTWDYLDYCPSNVTNLFITNNRKLIALGDNFYSNNYCNVWNSSLNVSDDLGINWVGDSRINQNFELSCQVDSNTIYGISNNKIVKIQKTIINSNSTLNDNRFNEISLFPNPARDFINIKNYLDLNESVVLEIYNIQGTLIKRNNLHSSNSIDIGFLSDGVYLIKLKNNNINFTEKMIIKKNAP